MLVPPLVRRGRVSPTFVVMDGEIERKNIKVPPRPYVRGRCFEGQGVQEPAYFFFRISEKKFEYSGPTVLLAVMRSFTMSVVT